MIDPRFVYLAMLLAAVGGYGYVRATLRGVTSPNRVTWSLGGLEGVLAFGVEIQQHVGLASWMTLTLKVITSEGALFPGCIVVTDFVMTVLIVARVGPRFRGGSVVAARAAT